MSVVHQLLSHLTAAIVIGRPHTIWAVWIKFEPFWTMVNHFQSVSLFQKCFIRQTNSNNDSILYRAMWVREWQSKGWFWSWNTVAVILNAQFTTTDAIHVCSSCRCHIISYWDCFWSSCSHASSLRSWHINQFEWPWAGRVEWSTDFGMDNKRGWCLCALSTSSQINTRNGRTIKTSSITMTDEQYVSADFKTAHWNERHESYFVLD